MILVSHPTGNAFVRALLQGLSARGQLDLFYTTICTSIYPKWLVQAPAAVTGDNLSRRNFPIPSTQIRTHAVRELVRLFAPRLGIGALTSHEKGWASMDGVMEDLDRFVAMQLSDRLASNSGKVPLGIYSYEDACLCQFRVAKRYGLRCFYELPIAYFETSRRLLQEEAERLPDWEKTLGGTRDSKAKLDRKRQEIDLADVVICPSEFVLGSIPSEVRQARKCIVVPFGTPDLGEEILRSPNALLNNRLRVLFAGSMGQRKGLADLFAAMKLLNRSDVELIVMGTPVTDMDFYTRQGSVFTYEPPRAHHQVLQLMSSCDVFALPSIVEGRALVLQEAMACGLPLIITPNTGGADLIEEGKTGFLVPIRSPQQIADKIAWFADRRQQLEDMRSLARNKSLQFTWQDYCEKIFAAIL